MNDCLARRRTHRSTGSPSQPCAAAPNAGAGAAATLHPFPEDFRLSSRRRHLPVGGGGAEKRSEENVNIAQWPRCFFRAVVLKS